MPLTEREVGLLWRYHDWLARHGYVLCERTKRPEPGLHGALTYLPVRSGHEADLLARFMAHEASDERGDEASSERRGGAQGDEEHDAAGEGDDGRAV